MFNYIYLIIFSKSLNLLVIYNRTVEEFQKGHVDAEKIINIPYMFNTPECKEFANCSDASGNCKL